MMVLSPSVLMSVMLTTLIIGVGGALVYNRSVVGSARSRLGSGQFVAVAGENAAGEIQVLGSERFHQVAALFDTITRELRAIRSSLAEFEDVNSRLETERSNLESAIDKFKEDPSTALLDELGQIKHGIRRQDEGARRRALLSYGFGVATTLLSVIATLVVDTWH